MESPLNCKRRCAARRMSRKSQTLSACTGPAVYRQLVHEFARSALFGPRFRGPSPQRLLLLLQRRSARWRLATRKSGRAKKPSSAQRRFARKSVSWQTRRREEEERKTRFLDALWTLEKGRLGCPSCKTQNAKRFSHQSLVRVLSACLSFYPVVFACFTC